MSSPGPLAGDSGLPLPDDVKLAHGVLERHYREPVLPISKVCDGLARYVQALTENESDGPYGAEAGAALRQHGAVIIMFARKSNLLWRLLYAGEKLRTRKCPEHDGHWSGCKPEPCPHGCSFGSDVTGWLPNE